MAYLIQVATGYQHGKPLTSTVCGNPVPKVEGWSDRAISSEMIKRCRELVNPKEIKMVHILLIGDEQSCTL